LVALQESLTIEWYDESGLQPQALNTRAKYLFSTELLDAYYFTALQPADDSHAKRNLGRTLFFDPILSLDVNRACASCHKPDLAFTDGQAKSTATGLTGTVQRNAPTLVNAVFAKAYFYDLRATPLQNQFEHVVFSEKEFNTSYAEIVSRLQQSEEYGQLFKDAFGKNANISKQTITEALEAYVASLRSYNTPVDAYLRGDEVALSDEVKHGFNLFMGKANCGTCHFAPTFSGLVPPFFDDSETEILGVPATAENKMLDADVGRAGGVLKQSAPIYRHSFKTTTVRNVALTGPYMHNGVYKTLEEIIEFYNKGGGSGYGFEVPYQTLPADSLGLSANEKSALIAFMDALTDTTGLSRTPTQLPKFKDEQLNNRVIGGSY
jgi:cytochrome c peroxidase